MKQARAIALCLVCAASLTSCASSNLVRWGFDKDSVYAQPDGEVSRSMLKPSLTILGMPIAFAWDVVTFPFQIIFGVHPYGSRYMDPTTNRELGI
jgi:hypothetical protein